MSPRIVIIDYGVGNLHSLQRALRHAGAKAVVSEDPEAAAKADALVLPGVGSFEAGMRGLAIRGLTDAVKRFAASGKPMLGICLGAQLLMSKGYEFGEHDGLGIVKGSVIRFPEKEVREKIPHIGWNTVREREKDGWKGTIVETLHPSFDAYFVHSYLLLPDNQADSLGVTEYGGYRFSSLVKSGTIYGCQFHPEKSGVAGLALIKHFVQSIHGRAAKNKTKKAHG